MGEQAHLPSHPYVSFKELTRSFSRKYVGRPFMRAAFVVAVSVWRKAFGIDAAERQIKSDIDAGRNGYWHARWTFQTMFFPEFLASFVLPADEEKDLVRKAAQLICGALDFRQRLKEGRVPPEFEAGKPLDMERYHYLYSRVMKTKLERGRLVHEVVDFPASDYVVVAIDGLYYHLKVPTIDAMAAYPVILAQVAAVVADALAALDGLDAERAPFGLLTTLNTKKSAHLFAALRQNDRGSVDVIDQALFLIAIDPNDHPVTLDRVVKTIHARNYDNRDPRRSMQLVVTGNGRAAAIVSPHTGIGGTYSARFCDELLAACRALRGTEHAAAAIPPHFRRLKFDLGWQHAVRPALARHEADLRRRIYSQRLPGAFRLEGVGKAAFERAGLSADAAFHCALNLAYFRCFGVKPVVGNFINLRNVRHGDIWRYPATSDAMERFLDQPSREKLLAAVAAHRALVKEHKQARDEFYLGAQTLKRLICQQDVPFVSFVVLATLASAFVKDFGRRFLNPDVWVSNIPDRPGVEICGRASVRMSYLQPKGIGGHYSIAADHIVICFLSSPSTQSQYGRETEFARALRAALSEVVAFRGG